MLRNAGLTFEQRPSSINERALEREALARMGSENRFFPGELALDLSSAKALDVSRKMPDALVIGADQLMACGGEIYHKPPNMDAARKQLRQLRGRRHSLYAGVSIAKGHEILWQHLDRADLTMREFSEAFLEEYCRIEGEHLLQSVGSYRIEGPGLQLFSDIQGDTFTIIGLPLLPVLGYLRKTGWLMR